MKTPVLAGKNPSPDNLYLFTTDHPDIPVPNKERIQFLDILRGIAILFILVANIRYLSGENFIPDLQKAAMKTASFDHVMEILAFIFVDGKFYSVFSILFGIGFAVQYQRMMKDDKAFVPFFRRRMAGLLIIGSVHLFLIWLGDTLTLYALAGFALIWFRHFSNKSLLLNELAITPMAMSYCAIVAIVVTRHPRWLVWFALVGKTALSNYLFQSLICIFIFYGVGLGYGGTLGYSGVLLVALLLFGWQIFFSAFWLRSFHFGPLEWIWRQLTYGKLIKLWKPAPAKNGFGMRGYKIHHNIAIKKPKGF